MQDKLKVGRISYLNLLPLFSAMEELGLQDKYQFVEGYPSDLNRMLRSGKLDISPSSSIEYLRDKGAYDYLDGHSISSRGMVRSILLFSRLPIEDICDGEVMATHQSETSIALLRIILKKFYAHDCALEVTEEPVHEAIKNHSAYLAIGDDALEAYYRSTRLGSEAPENCHCMCLIDHQAFYVYDIAELWLRHTGLPAVFALWTYRKDISEAKLSLIREFAKDLERARTHAMKNLPSYARGALAHLPATEVVSYWEGIIYDLPGDCIKGLDTFEQCLKEI